MASIFTFVPAFGQTLTASTFLTTHALVQTLHSKGIRGGVTTLSHPDIAELRDVVLTIWYDALKEYTHMLMIDADMSFEPQLVLDMLMFDKPLVGTIYRKRMPEIQWVGQGGQTKMHKREGGFINVDGIGFGCTLIRRDCVALMLEKKPEIVDLRMEYFPAKDYMVEAGAAGRLIRAFDKIDVPDKGVQSEDLSFCQRYRESGGEVWAAIGHNVRHIGPYSYEGCYLETAAKEHDAKLAAEAAQTAV